MLQTRVLVCRTLREFYTRGKPDHKQEIIITAITYVNGNKKCWLEWKSWIWGKGCEGLCCKEGSSELLRPYITGLSGERIQSTHQCNANILGKHHMLGIEGARQHEPRQAHGCVRMIRVFLRSRSLLA